MKKTISKIAMIAILLIFAILNLMYIIQVKGKIQCFGVSMILNFIENKEQSTVNLILFLIFILTLVITYLIIVFKEPKEADEKGIKKTFIFIFIVSIIAGIILPNNSSDVYYYIASGRADSIYGYDIYERNFLEIQDELKDDEVVSQSPRMGSNLCVWNSICWNL